MRAPFPAGPTSTDSKTAACGSSPAEAGYVSFVRHYADQNHTLDGGSMMRTMRNLSYNETVRWTHDEIIALKHTNWTGFYPAVETFSVRGANGSTSFDTEVSVSLPHGCVRESACSDWGQHVDVIQAIFERDGRWKASGTGPCEANVSGMTPSGA